MRIILIYLILALAMPAVVHANNFSYPGGVAVLVIDKEGVDLPTVRYGLKEPVLIDEGDKWKIIIGIELQQLPGQYHVYVRPSGEDDSPRFESFEVVQKAYPLIDDQDSNTVLAVNSGSPTELDFSNSQPPSLPMVLPIKSDWDNGFGQLFLDQKTGNTAPQNCTFSDAEPRSLVRSPVAGIVSRIDQSSDGLFSVTLDHGRGLYSIIHKINDLAVELGNGVTTGAVIGKVPEKIVSGPNPKSVASAKPNRNTSRVFWQVQLNEVLVNPLILTQI